MGAACGAQQAPELFDQADAYSSGHGSEVLLVERNGTTVAATTRSGWSVETPHRLASGTKSFAGVIAIAAVQDGFLALDEPVSATLTEWRGDPRKARITVRQLLNQSSGLDPAAGLPADDAYLAAISAPVINEPGTTFAYGPNHFSVFAALMERKLRSAGIGGDALAYLRSRVLDPIGARIADWDRDARGHPIFSRGSDFSAVEWVKFGRLIAQRGTWGNRKILDPALIQQMLTPSPANPRYGLGWWLNPGPEDDSTGPLPGVPADLVMAAGAGDQRLYVVPSRGLVVVRFGEEESFEDREFLTRLFRASPP